MDLSTKAEVFANLEEINQTLLFKKNSLYDITCHSIVYKSTNGSNDELVHYHLSITDNPYESLDVYRGSTYLFTVPPMYRDDMDDRLDSFGKANLSSILSEISLCQQSGNMLDATRLSLNELVVTVDDRQNLSAC